MLSIFLLIQLPEMRLDPFRPIKANKKPIKIQVVALQWKWLFIYPEERIASVNFFQLPEKTPINLEITADAPMNSFWIPGLCGQIYAMPNMKTKLHLIVNERGEFKGSSANLSGVGFSGMHFIAKASSEKDYHHWIRLAKRSQNTLSLKEYHQLARPSKNNPVMIYLLNEENLFNQIMMNDVQSCRCPHDIQGFISLVNNRQKAKMSGALSEGMHND
jgi:cytochrome o ubiquinol oxidase subunit II